MTDYTVGDTINHMFTTRRFSTGAPFTLAGTPVVSVYEDNSTTQITAGVTLTVDFDGVTGLNLLTIAATGGNGFDAGKDYNLVITTGTVDSISVVGEVIGHFTLQRSAAYADLENATDGLSALKNLIDTLDDFVDTEVAAIKAKTDSLPSDPADASDIAASFATVNGTLATLATAANLAIVAGYLDTEIAAILAKVTNLPSDPADASDIAASFASIAATLATLSAYVDTEVAAIKAKTDSLTFTKALELDVNIQSVNDVQVNGDGQTGTEWGP